MRAELYAATKPLLDHSMINQMKQCILVIDDNDDIRENTAELLELEGYHVIPACCGETGIRLAESQLPDLVICDIIMTGMDGYEVLQHLRQCKLTRKVPVVFSTCKSERSELSKAIELGVDDYLVKPYSEEQLFACVKKWLPCRGEHAILNSAEPVVE